MNYQVKVTKPNDMEVKYIFNVLKDAKVQVELAKRMDYEFEVKIVK